MADQNHSKTLIQAFSVENLNHITSKIIQFHKRKNYPALQKIARIVSEFSPIDPENKSRLFSNLVILFHPDKVKTYHETILQLKDSEGLIKFNYITAVLAVIDQIGHESDSALLTPDEFESEYGWNYQPTEDDYFMVREEQEPKSYWFDEENPDQTPYFDDSDASFDATFLSALKRKIYGPTYIDFPVHLLEDMEEIEMAEYEIEDLAGIEFCRYVRFLDLSLNAIFDISLLAHCTYIEELYLGSNQVHYIDSLQNMPELRLVDLSGNKVNDITPLLEHKKLEFVNLIGNPVPERQIQKLKAKGVVVIY
ncbi:MAG TPA: hypothetical protein DCQ26_15875 [Marinilabiliales bacterium]|jgi:Leucine-rich repeat (LRR) protein|nr:MAG: hypothetical protein A2W95_05025 [Bacteroidetes bacterium GWA2_40_14]OFX60466.1 MAG: hypothetical protein A2W84_05110 [Bacteroidetes bacterium GWC2_40_13]OFX75477.1 MAG: hypothetical protein A2W96_08460 [Bacteroidetes bacterium GWD2_40_43]OFX93992.1 MAG: hypothetical protein A2W97_14385 [Bacteroidetes bacterium GWE2_40_63]OFY19781.1 MAG: hypothetical protein A2W88_03255 [Bacteroidetes bacterium GWF2_40_13]OFZ28192.1 MAG: hypothetical protein A2437_04755 [Bacteroidetes bacterium RIFOXYC